MKKIILALLLFIAFNGFAQLGVATIKSHERIPTDQWYRYSGHKFHNKIFYFNENDDVDRVLDEIIAPWNVSIDDGEVDSDGDLFWVLDNNNGYYVTVYVTRNFLAPENSIITIITTEH